MLEGDGNLAGFLECKNKPVADRAEAALMAEITNGIYAGELICYKQFQDWVSRLIVRRNQYYENRFCS